MSGRITVVAFGAALLLLYWGFAILMRAMGSDIPYPTDLLPPSWRKWL